MSEAGTRVMAGAGAEAATGAVGPPGPPPTLEAVLRSTPRLSPDTLDKLRSWARAQPHFPPLTDLDLVRVLNGAGYDLERGKKVLDCYLSMRRHAPELFAYRDPRTPAMRRQLELFHVAPCGPDAAGRSVLCAGFARGAAAHLSAADAGYLLVAMVELVVRRDPGGPGYVVVADAANFTAELEEKVPMALVSRALAFYQEALPATVYNIHLINLTPAAEVLMNLIKPTLRKEVREKVFFYSSKKMNEFYKKVPQKFLPQDYGGSLEPSSLYYEQLKNELFESTDYLKYLDTLVVDENRRPGGPRKLTDYFGTFDALVK